jgi:hypothetical protein
LKPQSYLFDLKNKLLDVRFLRFVVVFQQDWLGFIVLRQESDRGALAI